MKRYIKDLDNLIREVEEDIRPLYEPIEQRALANHAKVLDAFRRARVSDYHLKGATGYGYGDQGREALEKVYARIFRAEAALVRAQIVSGTHAIALVLYGILRPGDVLLSLQGEPYDTLAEIIGIRDGAAGSLREFGVDYRQLELLPGGGIDYDGLKKELTGDSRVRLVMLQRSRGYSRKPSLPVKEIASICAAVKETRPDTVVFVDNCYGEFVEEEEPIEAGADIAAGSLIKNPGGGLAPTGGYVVGKERFVQMAAARWTAPGIGPEVGPAPDFQRLLFQGLFIAPHVVAESLKGAIFAARFFERLGFAVSPAYNEERTDIVQAVLLGSREKMVAFCRGIQKASPVDAHVLPEPNPMPGYGNDVVMAAGTFVQGASLELTADGPVRPPYAVYLQGGLYKEHVKLAVLSAAREVLSI
ncbi:MAG: methionine gamma-lyase family protein [Firmicutes bacterium]|nr:methionine gamma-lyase family protein [Bacillota bacterium]